MTQKTYLSRLVGQVDVATPKLWNQIMDQIPKQLTAAG